MGEGEGRDREGDLMSFPEIRNATDAQLSLVFLVPWNVVGGGSASPQGLFVECGTVLKEILLSLPQDPL